MTFIKSLRTKVKKKGQASLEYFIIFAVLALLTILSLSSLFPQLQNALQGSGGFFEKAIGVKGINVGNN